MPTLSIIFCLSSGDIYLSLDISLSLSLVTVSELFCCEFLETYNFLIFCYHTTLILVHQ